jgi:hypothetical protein
VTTTQHHSRHRHTSKRLVCEGEALKEAKHNVIEDRSNTIVISNFSTRNDYSVGCSLNRQPASNMPPPCALGRQCQPHCGHHAKEADDQHHVIEHQKTGYQRCYHPVVAAALD